ncbi:thymidylate kinase-domain-containing protein [Powellomyces hirtus]|nr:thymidylate kinase-domain-containing protein [Powellomyces hirtus]
MGKQPRGALVVFEGIDRSGKTSQTNLLNEALSARGIPSALRRFPDRTTPTGLLISSYLEGQKNLSDQVIHLLFSSNRWEATNEMKEMLESGTTLIVDRYAYSGVAYTAAKGAADLDWCKAPDRGLLTPDLVIYFDIPTSVAASRAEYGGERYEKVEFQEKVRSQFAKLGEGDKRWAMVDAARPVEDIHEAVLGLALEAVERAKNEPLREDLWVSDS